MPTLIEKIISRHAGKPVRPGDVVDISIDVRAARDFGGANVVRNLMTRHLSIEDVSKTCFTFDCNPTGSDQTYAANQQICRQFARQHHMNIYDIDQGIGTHLVIDKGLIGPGGTFVSTDSHANILGAIGALGLGMGDIDIAYAFSKGKIWYQVPPSIKIKITGTLPSRCSAKDLALALLKKYSADGLMGLAVELEGEAIDNMSLSERMTLASMATEMAGITLLIPPSETIIAYCRQAGAEFDPLFADREADYQRTGEINISNLEPLLSKPGRPDDVVPVRNLEGSSVDSVFIGSCTNGRYEDMQTAAKILKGHRIAEHVVLKIVPATDMVWQQCMRDGIFELFKEAGALIGNAGCAGCAAGQVGQNGPGEVTVSTGNRNYTGKQGKGSVYLASPATAAASAVAGKIVSADRLSAILQSSDRPIKIKLSDRKSITIKTAGSVRKKTAQSIFKGRVWVIRQDHIDTDMIYHNKYLSITDVNEMGQYTFSNLEGWQDFPKKARAGDMIVTGQNFGCGSSRQQAVDCFKNLGVQLVIARSFGAIFERNAINSALPVLKADLLDKSVNDGDCLEVSPATGLIRLSDGQTVQGNPFSKIQMRIYQNGGLL